jgi:hypothetical protein
MGIAGSGARRPHDHCKGFPVSESATLERDFYYRAATALSGAGDGASMRRRECGNRAETAPGVFVRV